MKIKTLTLIALLGSLSAFSQGGLSHFSGKVIDSETKQPIPEAYVSIPSVGYGTVVNQNGEFVFNFPRISADSQVVVSVLGYQNAIFKANEPSTSSINIIELTASSGFANTLGISDARSFVQSAIDSIKSNCSSEAIFQNGFYCEMVAFDKVGLVKVNEGIVRVERFPSATSPQDKLKYLRGRRLEWMGQTSKMDGFGFENGASIVTRSLETTLPSYLSSKELKNYEFTMDSLITTFDNIPVYSVSFAPASRRVKAPRTGKIYIEPISKAIVRVEYSMTPEAARDVMNTGFSNIDIKGKAVTSYMQYRKFGEKWMLQDAAINFEANFKDKVEKRFEVDATTTLRFVATISQTLVRSSIPEDKQLTSTENFPRTWVYSDDLWEGNNFLLPTPEMREIANRVN